MSRIDIICVFTPLLRKLLEVSILPRGISDLAPVLLSIQLHNTHSDRVWSLSRYWISDETVESPAEAVQQENAKQQRLHQVQCIFEQGDGTGCLLAWLCKEQSLVTSIAIIRDADGILLTNPIAINARFASQELYSSRVQ